MNDYYPFGMLMPGRTFAQEDYRYGFNGKEKDKEGLGGGTSTYDYGFRIYNPGIARFLSVDPLSPSYPWYTPYQFAGNKPIRFIDLDGLEEAEAGTARTITVLVPVQSDEYKEHLNDFSEVQSAVPVPVTVIVVGEFGHQVLNRAIEQTMAEVATGLRVVGGTLLLTLTFVLYSDTPNIAPYEEQYGYLKYGTESDPRPFVGPIPMEEITLDRPIVSPQNILTDDEAKELVRAWENGDIVLWIPELDEAYRILSELTDQGQKQDETFDPGDSITFYQKSVGEQITVKVPFGYVKVKGKSRGQPVFKHVKKRRYISPDTDGHNGGIWKMAGTQEDLGSKTTRTGTYNEDLTKRIGD